MRRSFGTRAALAVALGAAVLTGCGGGGAAAAASLPDGSYTGQSAPDDDGAYGVIDFTVASGAVTEASFTVYDADGTAHDEDYGLGADGTPADETSYRRAQNAIEAEQQYVTDFEEVGDQNQVDVIAGASLSHQMFVDAVDAAVADAGA